MAQTTQDDWLDFHRSALRRTPREMLGRTLSLRAAEGRKSGVAVDLGAGYGAETQALLRAGWVVHAVDVAADRLAAQRERVPLQQPEMAARLHLHNTPMQDFELPRCDLVWASWSLPYCPATQWPALLQRLHKALNAGGRFAGDLFGPRHAWAGEADLFTISKTALRQQLRAMPFKIEAFDIEDGLRVAGDGLSTRWHAFAISVRRPG